MKGAGVADRNGLGLVKTAKSLSSALPDLLVEARRVAAKDYDDAVSKFAQTLRTGGSPDSAFSALSLAWSSLGCDAQGQLGCAQVGEMKTLLAPYKKIP